MKLLFFMKISPAYGFLVQMIYLSMLDIAPFLALYALGVLFFAIENQVLRLEYAEDEYNGVPRFASMILLAFRNSLGDL